MNGRWLGVVLSVALLALVGCDRGKGASGGGNSGGGSSAEADKAEKEAIDAVMAEVNKHWVKTADGSTSAFNSGNQFAPNYLRQLRDISAMGFAPADLDESDKLNGIQWAGQVTFKKTPSREAGDSGPVMADWGGGVFRGKGHWSQWVDVTPEFIKVQKVKGQCQVPKQETMLLSGTRPTAGDYQTAGVKP